MKIRFTLDCFKDEFRQNILKSLGYESYFDYLNSELQNPEYFTIEISKVENDVQTLNITEEDLIKEYNSNNKSDKKVTFKNELSSNDSENESTLVSNMSEEEVEEEDLEEISSIEADEEDEHSQILTKKIVKSIDSKNVTYKFVYEKTFSNILLSCVNSENINKNLKRSIRKKGGRWHNEKKGWIFPLSAYSYVVQNLNATEIPKKSNKEQQKKVKKEKRVKPIQQEQTQICEGIEKFYESNNKIYIVPKKDHPNYGKTIVYDKIRNMGIWDVLNKAWVFDKKN